MKTIEMQIAELLSVKKHPIDQTVGDLGRNDSAGPLSLQWHGEECRPYAEARKAEIDRLAGGQPINIVFSGYKDERVSVPGNLDVWITGDDFVSPIMRQYLVGKITFEDATRP